MINLLIIDDDSLLRQCVAEMLRKRPQISVVGEAEEGQLALEMIQQKLPDVVLMNINMKNVNGIELIRQIGRLGLNTKIVILSIFVEHPNIHLILNAGASGYLTQNSGFDEITNAIRAVINGNKYISPSAADDIYNDYLSIFHIKCLQPNSCLTYREAEVLQLVTGGKSTKEISRDLKLSTKTVEAHRLNIMNKLKIYSIAGLTKYAMREKMTSVKT